MIPESIMGRVAHSAGIQDRWLVTLDVLSVYLLQHLNETGMLSHMCFKGGISLRKVFARLPSRFSRDVDFVDASYQQLSDKGLSAEEYYYELLEAFDGQTIHDIHWKLKALSGVELTGDSLRVDLHFFMYDDSPADGWVEPATLAKRLRERFSFLRELTTTEQELCDDRAKHKSAVHDELWEACKNRFANNKLSI